MRVRLKLFGKSQRKGCPSTLLLKGRSKPFQSAINPAKNHIYAGLKPPRLFQSFAQSIIELAVSRPVL
jgi:hypothetical protein